jgi:hypothetical protein
MNIIEKKQNYFYFYSSEYCSLPVIFFTKLKRTTGFKVAGNKIFKKKSFVGEDNIFIKNFLFFEVKTKTM